MTEEHNTGPSKQLITWLAMLGGLGMILTITGAIIGVIGGETLDDNAVNLIGLMVVSGLGLLFLAIISWFATVQPHKHFDDINLPLEEEHHH